MFSDDSDLLYTQFRQQCSKEATTEFVKDSSCGWVELIPPQNSYAFTTTIINGSAGRPLQVEDYILKIGDQYHLVANYIIEPPSESGEELQRGINSRKFSFVESSARFGYIMSGLTLIYCFHLF